MPNESSGLRVDSLHSEHGNDDAREAAAGKANASIPNGVPRYVLDLSLPPLERYRRIVGDFKMHFKEVEKFVEAEVSELTGTSGLVTAFVLKCAQGALHVSSKLSMVYYNDELKAIAELSGMALGKVIMMQLVYEAFAMCTSVAVPTDAEGHVAHIRTMDWEMDMLKKLTIELEVRDGPSGVPKALITTWAGYVGALTGVALRGESQKRDGFSVSVNFRNVGSGTLGTNLKKALKSAWPVGFLVREALMLARDYSECAAWLSTSKLIAPCYFTVAGAQPWQACQITRCRDHSLRPLHMRSPAFHIDGDKLRAPKSQSTAFDNDDDEHNDQDATVLVTQHSAHVHSPRPEPEGQSTARRSGLVKRKLRALVGRYADQPSTDDTAANAGDPADPTTQVARAEVADFLVQPNMDHWASVADDDSVERRKLARSRLGRLVSVYAAPHDRESPEASSMPSKELWAIMSLPPILDDITIYGTLMDPSNGTMESRLPYRPPAGATRGRLRF